MQVNSSTSSILSQVQEKQESLMEKLASGKKVNDATDGAAAQQIIDRLTSEVEGNRQAINNVYDDVNRIRELTLQSGNGVLSDGDRRAIQSEITQLQENISQTIEQTNFAGKPLLSDTGSLEFQSGSSTGQSISINTQDIAANLNDVLSIDITAGTSVEDSLGAADAAIETLGSARGDLGATQNRFESAARTLTQANVNTAESRSRIQDLDFAQAASERASNDVLGQAALTVQAQANQQQNQVLSLLS